MASLILNTKKAISQRGMMTFEAIESRLLNLSPKIFIRDYIAQESQLEKVPSHYSSLETHEDTLDGINFRTDKPEQLANAFYNVKDLHGERAFASMKGDPKHCALKASFGATVGTGWREIWRPKPYSNDVLSNNGMLKQTNHSVDVRFGTAGLPVMYTALHSSIDKISGKCNIHIDESGFFIWLPTGLGMTPDAPQHLFNELVLKTIARDWLVSKVSDEDLKKYITEAFRRVSIIFPNASNEYAGLKKTINSFQRPTNAEHAVTGAIRGVFKIMQPVGLSIDIMDNQNFKLQLIHTRSTGEKSNMLTLGRSF